MDIHNCKWDVSRTSTPLPAKEVHQWNNNMFEGEGWIGKKVSITNLIKCKCKSKISLSSMGHLLD
jgi:hypothetical protein